MSPKKLELIYLFIIITLLIMILYTLFGIMRSQSEIITALYAEVQIEGYLETLPE